MNPVCLCFIYNQLYSNRSAAYAALKRFSEALQDANECLSLQPKFVKGYSRRALALFNLKRLDEANRAYTKGIYLCS